jgi:hypothetical protein
MQRRRRRTAECRGGGEGQLKWLKCIFFVCQMQVEQGRGLAEVVEVYLFCPPNEEEQEVYVCL